MDDARARTVLGVTVDAPPEAVRAAYRRLLRRHHPDIAGGSGTATSVTAELNAAYAILTGDPPTPTPTPPTSAARTPSADRPPSPGPAAPRVTERTTFDMADDADGVIAFDESSTTELLDIFNRLCEAADHIGDLSYVDRANTILETMITPAAGPTCSLMVTLEQRGSETLAYCTLESLDARPGPPIEEVVGALTRQLDRLGDA